MEMLTSANAELARRPDDEHHTLASFRAAASLDRQRGREFRVRAAALLFTPAPDSFAGIACDVGTTGPVALNHYSLSQACALAGTSPSFLARIQPATRVRVLNEALNREELSDRIALVNVDADSGARTMRAMTSGQYKRLWDSDILDNVERWLLPQGWIPAVPSFRSFGTSSTGSALNSKGNDKPALFRGDRDSFQFYYSPKSDRPDLGGLRRGIVVYNSEVGARSFGFDCFLFRDMCGNFLIHGAQNVQRKRARHVGRVESLFGEFRMMLRDYSTELDNETTKRLLVAAETMFAESDAKANAESNAAARLVRQYKATQATAAAVAKAAFLPINRDDGDSTYRNGGESKIDYFAIANGASWLAHEERNADAKMAAAALAGKVLDSVPG